MLNSQKDSYLELPLDSLALAGMSTSPFYGKSPHVDLPRELGWAAQVRTDATGSYRHARHARHAQPAGLRLSGLEHIEGDGAQGRWELREGAARIGQLVRGQRRVEEQLGRHELLRGFVSSLGELL